MTLGEFSRGRAAVIVAASGLAFFRRLLYRNFAGKTAFLKSEST
jgi:hypothetical protein